MPAHRFSFGSLAAVILCLGCVIASAVLIARSSEAARPDQGFSREPEPLAADGIENLWRLPLSDRAVLYSGSQPESDAGFASLQQLGVRTLISVDGARPEIELAAKHGLRYVHFPIGYNDVPADQLARMAAAVQSLPGPVFVHCHHGKHRGPASAACIWRALRADITSDEAIDLLHRTGTAEKYRGLYRAAARVPPTPSEIRSASKDFPSFTAVAPLAEQMVGIDHAWEQIRGILQSSDLSADDRRMMEELWADGAERFREAARLMNRDDSSSEADLRRSLEAAGELWDSLSTAPASQRQALAQRAEQQCQQCHARHRDGN